MPSVDLTALSSAGRASAAAESLPITDLRYWWPSSRPWLCRQLPLFGPPRSCCRRCLQRLRYESSRCDRDRRRQGSRSVAVTVLQACCQAALKFGRLSAGPSTNS